MYTSYFKANFYTCPLIYLLGVITVCVCLCVCMCEAFDDTLMTIDQWGFFLKDNSLGHLTRFLK